MSEAGRAIDSAVAAAPQFQDILAAERERWALWLPVFFGAGAGLYFALPDEPAAWIGPTLVVAALLTAALDRRRAAVVLSALALVTAGTGLCAAQIRTHMVAAPVLVKPTGAVAVAGRVVVVEPRPTGKRVTLDRLTIAGVASVATPERVRISLRRAPSGLAPGDMVAVRAMLSPPPAPAAPGAYDFQRQAWFDRLGGVGFALGAMTVNTQSVGLWSDLSLALASLRQIVAERTMAAVPGPAGTIAAALLTGEQGAVPADVMNAMRDSGLAHILSISGLHISLVAGIVFFTVRLGLALVPPLALRYPIKKWAALAALAAITFYTLFATPGVPTQRSWLMTAIVLLAVTIDRTAISMRLIAWAALAILAVEPESLLGPSFQMSFAAVVALIAAWEAIRPRYRAWRLGATWLRRAAVALAGVAMTTLVAGFASAPYALYHFNRFTLYGLAANLMGVPLTSIWVMPWAVMVFVLFPFGLQEWALKPMGWGVDGLIAIAERVAAWDGAVALFPAMPTWGLAIITMGGLWLCLWRTRWRLLGAPAIALGLASILTVRGPDILVSDDAKLLAVRGENGLLELSSPRTARLTRETWLRRAGQEKAVAWPKAGDGAGGRLVCDPQACRYTAAGQTITLVRDPAALTANCRKPAAMLISTIYMRYPCRGPDRVIDRTVLTRNGAHAIWLDEKEVRVVTVRETRGDRPWTAPPPEIALGPPRSAR